MGPAVELANLGDIMKKNWALYLPLLFFGVFIAFLFGSTELRQTGDNRAAFNALVGKQLPASILASLEKHLEGREQGDNPYLVNVWATWCPTCYQEHAFLMELKEQGVDIIGVNYKDDTQKAMSMLQKLGNPYSVNLEDERGRLSIDLGVAGAPETYLVGSDNIIYYKRQGILDQRVWGTEIAPLYQQLMQRPAIPDTERAFGTLLPQ